MTTKPKKPVKWLIGRPPPKLCVDVLAKWREFRPGPYKNVTRSFFYRRTDGSGQIAFALLFRDGTWTTNEQTFVKHSDGTYPWDAVEALGLAAQLHLIRLEKIGPFRDWLRVEEILQREKEEVAMLAAKADRMGYAIVKKSPLAPKGG